ncbi:MAG: hypothetical protein J7513_03545 [Solirubrobacteraceae bacterium]|nr:hypothetical protein [Solirubrobacteraceae bacterium]
MSTTNKPSRRVTALATLAFASAVTGGGAHSAAAATAATPRSAPPTPRSSARPASGDEVTMAAKAGEARLDLPADLDLTELADALGVHPGRLEAAVRKLRPDETRSVGGLDPLTALAQELGLPPTDVYLAVARIVARNSR